jgi:hypothetical protein
MGVALITAVDTSSLNLSNHGVVEQQVLLPMTASCQLRPCLALALSDLIYPGLQLP